MFGLVNPVTSRAAISQYLPQKEHKLDIVVQVQIEDRKQINVMLKNIKSNLQPCLLSLTMVFSSLVILKVHLLSNTGWTMSSIVHVTTCL